LRALRIDGARFDASVAAEREEVARRVQRYRGGRPLPELAGRDVVLVDDGLATGVTAEAALRDIRALAPRRLVLAVPVGVRDTVERLRAVADDVICAHVPGRLRSVGEWYRHFDQTSDDDVLTILGRLDAGRPATDGPSAG
jgi:predicted phosphoribosyltransferase